MSKKPETAIEKLQAAYDAAREKLKESNAALGELAGLIKDSLKEDRQQRQEVESVRSALGKIQGLKI